MGRDGGDFLAVGTNHSAVQLWDASKLRKVKHRSNTVYKYKQGDTGPPTDRVHVRGDFKIIFVSLAPFSWGGLS